MKKKGEPKPEPQLNDFGSATLPKSIDKHCWYVRRRKGNCPFVITWTEFSTDRYEQWCSQDFFLMGGEGDSSLGDISEFDYRYFSLSSNNFAERF